MILPKTRLDDLLSDEALFGLNETEEEEIRVLKQQYESSDFESHERIAAIAHLALLERKEGDWRELSCPESIKQSIRKEIQSKSSNETQHPSVGADQVFPARAIPKFEITKSWALAALFFVAWITTLFVRLDSEDLPGVNEQFQSFRGTFSDIAVMPLERGPDSTGQRLTGEVYWSPTAKFGYLIIDDLTINDPTIEQYQLWIFDDRTHPVDGGVFDVDSAHSVISIDAKLNPRGITTFAITVEQPGGVVVSQKERVAALAHWPN